MGSELTIESIGLVLELAGISCEIVIVPLEMEDAHRFQYFLFHLDCRLCIRFLQCSIDLSKMRYFYF